MNKYLAHLKTITKHKILVGYYCCKCGQVKRGLMHDNSKFGLTEFFTSAKYFQGNISPIDKEKAEKGYSIAWQHHKGHNPHHWEWWIDSLGNRKNTPLKVEWPYLIEMICDWIGAGKVYSKKTWTQAEPYNYYMKVRNSRIINPETEEVIIYLLEIIKDCGISAFCYIVKHPEKSKVLSDYLKGE